MTEWHNTGLRDASTSKNDLRSRSRNESETKMTGNRDREVRFLENFREF